MHRLVIHGRPRSQKNNRRALACGKVVVSNTFRKWQKDAITQLRLQWRGIPKLTKPIEASVLVYQDKGQAIDLDNALTSAFDALQKAGVIANDYQIDRLVDPVARFRDPKDPRIEIRIKERAK